jgi:hypothetical protein
MLAMYEVVYSCYVDDSPQNELVQKVIVFDDKFEADMFIIGFLMTFSETGSVRCYKQEVYSNKYQVDPMDLDQPKPEEE